MKLYCLSGLGVDERAFMNFNLNGVELIHIGWIEPNIGESLSQYSKRLFFENFVDKDYYLLGVSFGGMVATEFAKIMMPKKLFLISTYTSQNQLPFIYRAIFTLKVHRIVPIRFLKSSNVITNYFFGISKPDEKQLLKMILKDTDLYFLKWAINAIVKWKNKEIIKGIRIHGDSDRIIPLPKELDYTIEKGGHFMIVSKADEIVVIINQNLIHFVQK